VKIIEGNFTMIDGYRKLMQNDNQVLKTFLKTLTAAYI
jgi:hypothetical protein